MNSSSPEVVLFTFSKMAAGMYLEHYLDSENFLLFKKCTEKNLQMFSIVQLSI